MVTDHEEWCTISEAARRAGVTRAAIRNKIKRKTIQSLTDNHGNPLVRLPVPDTGVPGGTPCNVTGGTTRDVTPGTSRDVPGGTPARTQADLEPEPVAVPVSRAEIDRLQANHEAMLTLLNRQFEQERAETARRVAEIQAMHHDLVTRLQAQAARERGLWLERVDAAELRAERVEQRLDQVLDHLLSERRPLPASPESQQPDSSRESWWSRLFGTSKKSEVR